MASATARGKLLRISSEDKQRGQTNTDFSVVLNNASFVQNVRGVVAKSVSFKHVFPNVFEGNRQFLFKYNGVNEYVDVEIPIAWYNVDNLREALETAINADPAIQNPITVTLSTNVNPRFVFTASGGDTIAIISKADANPMGDVLGITVSTALGASQTANVLPDRGGLRTSR